MAARSRTTWLVAAASAAALAGTAATALGGSVAITSTGAGFGKGGAVCLQNPTPAGMVGGDALTYRLQTGVINAGKKAPRAWWVNGTETSVDGSVPLLNYVNPVAGTAVIARPNNAQQGPSTLQVSLHASSDGLSLDGTQPGVWTNDYVWVLNPRSLVGTYRVVNTFIPNAGVSVAPVPSVLQGTLRRINCNA